MALSIRAVEGHTGGQTAANQSAGLVSERWAMTAEASADRWAAAARKSGTPIRATRGAHQCLQRLG